MCHICTCPEMRGSPGFLNCENSAFHSFAPSFNGAVLVSASTSYPRVFVCVSGIAYGLHAILAEPWKYMEMCSQKLFLILF